MRTAADNRIRRGNIKWNVLAFLNVLVCSASLHPGITGDVSCSSSAPRRRSYTPHLRPLLWTGKLNIPQFLRRRLRFVWISQCLSTRVEYFLIIENHFPSVHTYRTNVNKSFTYACIIFFFKDMFQSSVLSLLLSASGWRLSVALFKSSS